jgi:hypothetical protein
MRNEGKAMDYVPPVDKSVALKELLNNGVLKVHLPDSSTSWVVVLPLDNVFSEGVDYEEIWPDHINLLYLMWKYHKELGPVAWAMWNRNRKPLSESLDKVVLESRLHFDSEDNRSTGLDEDVVQGFLKSQGSHRVTEN